MRTRFHIPSVQPSRSTQGIRRRQVQRPKLSKEARTALIARRRQASESYHKALANTWSKINESAEEIAVAHHKSVARVKSEIHMNQQLAQTKRNKTNAWNAFCWKKSQDKENDKSRSRVAIRGKAVLQSLVHDHQDEYNALTLQERKEIIRDFEEHKATLTKARRTSTKSRINNVTHTLQAVENELNNLKSRTGVEVLLFATRGTTDMPLKSISFTTSGVTTFLEGVMKIDTQHFLGKLEGFAVQGIQGAAKNHQQRVSAIRADIRQEINERLRIASGDDKAQMEWKNYWRNVVKRYRVIIEGWPDNIPFCNLSDASNSLLDLESLLRKWKCGRIVWKKLTHSELEALDKERDVQIEDGKVMPPQPRRRRSDFGKKRSQKGKKSAQSNDGDENDEDEDSDGDEDKDSDEDEDNEESRNLAGKKRTRASKSSTGQRKKARVTKKHRSAEEVIDSDIDTDGNIGAPSISSTFGPVSTSISACNPSTTPATTNVPHSIAPATLGPTPTHKSAIIPSQSEGVSASAPHANENSTGDVSVA